MSADQTTELVHEELTEKIIGVFYDVYNELGHGFLESVYHKAMVVAMSQAGLEVKTKVPVTVYFRGQPLSEFEVDVLVEEKCRWN